MQGAGYRGSVVQPSFDIREGVDKFAVMGLLEEFQVLVKAIPGRVAHQKTQIEYLAVHVAKFVHHSINIDHPRPFCKYGVVLAEVYRNGHEDQVPYLFRMQGCMDKCKYSAPAVS